MRIQGKICYKGIEISKTPKPFSLFRNFHGFHRKILRLLEFIQEVACRFNKYIPGNGLHAASVTLFSHLGQYS